MDAKSVKSSSIRSAAAATAAAAAAAAAAVFESVVYSLDFEWMEQDECEEKENERRVSLGWADGSSLCSRDSGRIGSHPNPIDPSVCRCRRFSFQSISVVFAGWYGRK